MFAPALALVALLASPLVGNEPNCGVASVLALADALGFKVPEPAANQLASNHSGESATLAEVRDMAAGLGIPLAGFKATPDELLQRGEPCIVHLQDPDHFTCLVGLDEHWVQLLDGWPSTLSVVDRAWLDAHYTGACLLREPPPQGGPRLRLDARHVNFDAGEAGKTVEHRCQLTNTGDQPLTLRTRSSSCSCTTTSAPEFTVEPAQTTEIPITLRLSPGHGKMEHLRLTTNDPACPVLFLSIRVESVPQNIRFAPEEVAMGGPPGTRPTARFRIVGPSDLFVDGAACVSDLVAVRVTQRELGEERHTFTLELTAVAGLKSGRHEGVLKVVYHDGVPATLAVPVTVVVDPVARAAPARVVGVQELPGRWKGSVLITAQVPGQAVPVTGVRVEGLERVEATLHRIGAGYFRVDLVAELKPGVVRGKLVVALDSVPQPELEVPLTFAVGE